MLTNSGFNNEKYFEIQKEEIFKRVKLLGGKLYLEVGGKLIDDNHAARVLPGFAPDTKMRVLSSLKDESEVVIVVNTNDIKNRKVRNDNGITYDVEAERLIYEYVKQGLYVNSVVLSFYEPNNELVETFARRMKRLKINVYKHYRINGYPRDISIITSKDGLGKNEYIKTTKPIVIVTAPGPGSGKMATCLSQLYHDNLNGIKSGYAKFETFPVWNLPLNHPVNIAYEAATVDLQDVNMIDPYHLEKYGTLAVNYNRDVEAFPLLRDIFKSISGECPYNSPTDMGVNMVGFAIDDDHNIQRAAKREVIRRYYETEKKVMLGSLNDDSLMKIEMLMKKLDLSLENRKCVKPALDKAEKCGRPVVAIELKDGTIVTGKRSDLLTATSACLLNALKTLASIDDKLVLISRSVIQPIIDLKLDSLHNNNPKIHAEEVLIALAIQANNNPLAELALSKIHELENCEAHSSCLLDPVDLHTLNKLSIRTTEEPRSYFYKKIVNN